MLAVLNSLNAYNLPIFEPILMILVSKFMVHRALSDKIYLSLGLLSPLICLVYSCLMCEIQLFPMCTVVSMICLVYSCLTICHVYSCLICLV